MKNLALAFCLLALASCSHYYYYPTFQVNPSTTQKKELQGTAFMSDASHGIALNYSVGNHIGIFGVHNQFDIGSSMHRHPSTYMSDMGVYGFGVKPLSNNSYVAYNISGAICYGQYQRSYDYKVNLSRAYLQPGIHYNSTFVDIGISNRFTIVGYQTALINKGKMYYPNAYHETLGLNNKSFWFSETNLSLGLGYDGIKLYGAINFLNPIDNVQFNYYQNAFYIGLSVHQDLDKLFHKLFPSKD
jgi:hypothetical protein